MDRPWDVVLLGATGFTGQLVAEVLVRRTEPLRWAIAGRDPHKLRDVKAGLVALDPERGGAVGLLLADTGDPAGLNALAAQARVLVNTVGPYVDHGLPVVEACVRAGTHYLDLTGEPAFVNESRRRFDEAARSAGIRVVHCCGFDSIPADLGALFTATKLPADAGKQIRAYVRTRGGLSGGTLRSAIGAMAGRRPPGATTEGRGGGGGGGAPMRPLLHRAPADVGGFALPMPVIDVSIVRRSARARPDLYGPSLDYRQFLVVRSRGRAARLAAQVGALSLLARVGPARRLLESRFRSGEGPDDATRARSRFSVTFVGRGGGRQVVTRVSGGDPGYTETSRMLAACATLLATRADALPEAAGVLTPAVAFGEPLIAALQRIGLRFEVLPESGARDA